MLRNSSRFPALSTVKSWLWLFLALEATLNHQDWTWAGLLIDSLMVDLMCLFPENQVLVQACD